MDAQACKLCGTTPATRFVIRRHVGMLLLQKFYKVDAVLCARHGHQIASEFLMKTLVQGWWGITSFFFNIRAVVNDATMLARANRLKKLGSVSIPPAPIS
jgi:hypothetical protein